MKMFLLLLNIAQFCIILVLTNPDELAHRKVLVDRLGDKLQTNASIVDKISDAAGALGDLGATYHNYEVFSTTEKEGKTLTFGVLGHVMEMEKPE
jgi:hypothetical protein